MAYNPYESSKKRGEKGSSLFAFLKTDAKFFKIDKEGSFAIDIIPYKIATKSHPAVASGDAEIGDETYVLDVFLHRNIGPKKATIICPNKTFGKKCPICEQYEVAKKEHGWDSEEAKALAVQHRVVYNVLNVDDPDSGIQLFDTSYAYFEKELLEQAEADGPDFDVDFVAYGSTDPGYTIKFRSTEEVFGKNKYFKFKNFKFKERAKGDVKQWLDKAYALDELMITRTYEEISDLFYGQSDDEDEDDAVEEEKPRSRKPSDDDEDEPKKPAKETKPDCFGDPEKFDELKECDKCPLWSDCRVAKKSGRK